MEIEINMSSATPVYEQIVQQVKQGVLDGALKSGDNLPAIRQLAGDLNLNQNTIAKAYKMLEQQHVTVNRGRRGTCIHERALDNVFTGNNQRAVIELDSLITMFHERGMDSADICDVLEQQLNQLKE